MNNPLLAEEISFYGASEGIASANFYAGATTAQSANPYAVLALFDANFATFGADYAAAIASIEAAIAELASTISELDKHQNAASEDKSEAIAAATQALLRAQASSEFAADVSAREKNVIVAQKAIAKELGVAENAKDLGAQIASKVAAQTGISAEQLKQVAANVADSGATAALVASKIKLNDEANKTIIAQAQKESAAASSAQQQYVKAKAELAKKAAQKAIKLAEQKAAGASEEVIKQLKEDADAAANKASDETAVRAAASEINTAVNQMQSDATTANNKKAAQKGLSEEQLKQAAKEEQANAAKAEAAKAEAAKAEQDAASKYAIEHEGAKIVFNSVQDYLAVRGEKAADAAMSDILALQMSELAGKGVAYLIDAEGAKMSVAVAADAANATISAAGLKFDIEKTSKISDMLGIMQLLGGGKTASEITAQIKALNGHKLEAASNNLKLTIDGVAVQFSPDATGKKFSKESLSEIAGASLQTKSFEHAEVAAVGKASVEHDAAGYIFISFEGVADKTFAFKQGEISLKTLADVAAKDAAESGKAIVDAAKAAGIIEVAALGKVAASGDAALNAMSEFAAKIGDAKAPAIASVKSSDESEVIGVLIKTTAGYDWAVGGSDLVVKNISVADAKQTDLATFSGKDRASVANLKKLFASTAKTATVQNEDESLQISFGEENASTTMLNGATLTLADDATLGAIAGLKGNATFSELNTAKVKAYGDFAIDGATSISLGADAAKITFTVGANTIAAGFKALNDKSTIDALVAAGVTAVGEHAIEELGGKYLVSIAGAKYAVKSIADATASALKGATSSSAFLAAAETDVSASTNEKISTLLDDAQVGDFVLVKCSAATKGRLTKTKDGYSWLSDDGKVAISSVNADETISKLVAVANASATIAAAQAVAAEGAKISLNGAQIPEQVGKKAYDAGATFAALEGYLKAPNVSDLATLSGAINDLAALAEAIDVPASGIKTASDSAIVIYHTSGDWSVSVSSPAVGTLTKLAASTAINNLKALSTANAANVKTALGATGEIKTTAGDVIKVSGSDLVISGLKIDTTKANDLSKLMAIAKVANVDATGENVAFAAAAGKQTLDLSKFAATTLGNSGAADADAKDLALEYDIKLNAGKTFSIAMPKIKSTQTNAGEKGANYKIAQIKLSDFEANDVLKLSFGSAPVKGTTTNLTSWQADGKSLTAETGGSIVKLGVNGVDATAVTDGLVQEVASVLDAQSTNALEAGASYYIEGNSCMYVINIGGEQGTSAADAVIVKLTGVSASDAFAISGTEVTITGAGAAE